MPQDEARRLNQVIDECLLEPGNGLIDRALQLASMVAVLRAALHGGVERLRAHTDCDTLAALWLRQRDDPRLEMVRGLVGTLRHFELRHVPRQHNQPAHRLARRAIAHSDEETT